MAPEGRNRFQDDEPEQAAPAGIRGFIAARLGVYQDPAEIARVINEWVNANKTRALIYAIIAAVLCVALLSLAVWKIIEIRTRPTISMALAELDYGAYGSADATCERLLGFTSAKDTVAMATIFFIKGVSLANMTDVAWTKERQSYYRAAAGFLQTAEQLGFPAGRAATGYFYLGKCYYLAGDVVRARTPLLKALDFPTDDKRSIYWYLANSAFYLPNPDFEDALNQCDLYCRASTTSTEERDEGLLLKSLILTRLGRLDEADAILKSLPKHDHLQTMRAFVEGQLRLEQARVVRDRAEAIAKTTFFPSETHVTPKPSTPLPSLSVPPIDDNSDLPLPTPSTITEPTTDPPAELPSSQPVTQVAYQTDEATPSTPPSSPPKSGPVRITPIFTNATADNSPPPLEVIDINSDDAASRPAAPLPPPIPEEPTVTRDPVAQAVEQARNEAISLYEQAIACMTEVSVLDTGDFPWAASAYLITGLAYDELSTLRIADDINRAAQSFQEILQQYPDRPEATAADFLLAEQYQRNGDVKNAIAFYRRAFKQLAPDVGYVNVWFTRGEMMRRSQEIFDKYVAAKDFPMAFEFLEAWRTAIPASEYYRDGAYTVARWGDELSRLAAAAIKDKHDTLARDAREKYKIAGAWFERLAQYDFTQPHYVRLLWDSAEYYRHGWDYPNAIRMYQRYLEYNVTDRQFEAKFHIANLWFHLDYLDRAIDDFTKLLAEDVRHPLAATARLQLARAYFEKQQWDLAQQCLIQNLSSDYAPSSTLYSDSLYLLGAIDYQKKDYEQATIHLEDAILLHPKAQQAAEANYTLALCHLKDVARLQSLYDTTILERPRADIKSQIAAEYAAAGECFQRTERLLATRQDVANLSTSEQLLQRNSLFGIGEMQMKRELYDEASLTYNMLASRYGGEPVALYALMHLATASEKLGRFTDARAALKQADYLLATLRASGKFPPDFRFTEPEWASLLQLEQTVTKVYDIEIPEASD
ncbi:MAG: tetratricopeptide repeat protein [Thermoguttaceae bacterium]